MQSPPAGGLTRTVTTFFFGKEENGPLSELFNERELLVVIPHTNHQVVVFARLSDATRCAPNPITPTCFVERTTFEASTSPAP